MTVLRSIDSVIESAGGKPSLSDNALLALHVLLGPVAITALELGACCVPVIPSSMVPSLAICWDKRDDSVHVYPLPIIVDTLYTACLSGLDI